MSREVYVLDAVRTPIGRYGGGLAGVRPDDLAAHVVREIVARNPGLDPARIDDVLLGDANGAGEDNRDVARMAVLLAGLPPSVPGATVNRLCGSGLEAVIGASRAIALGDASVCLAGGVESMSRAPWVLAKPEQGYPARTRRCTRPRWAGAWSTPGCPSSGRCRSVRAPRSSPSGTGSAATPRTSSRCAATSSPTGPGATARTPTRWCRCPTPTSSGTRASGRPPHSRRWAGSSRSSGPTARSPPATPRRSTTARASCCSPTPPRRNRSAGRRWPGSSPGRSPPIEPHLFGIGPVAAAEEALRRAGIGWGDLDVVELNEAFAAQSLACLAHWPELDPKIVNPQGGAIALGHPLGSSGSRILGSLAWQLHRRGGGRGLAAICIGVGQGLAVVLEA